MRCKGTDEVFEGKKQMEIKNKKMVSQLSWFIIIVIILLIIGKFLGWW